MSEVEFTERLDQAIEVMLRDPDAPPAAEDQTIADVLSIDRVEARGASTRTVFATEGADTPQWLRESSSTR